MRAATLTITTQFADSADDELAIVFIFFPENGIWHFMKCQIPFSGKNKIIVTECRLLKIIPGVLSVKEGIDDQDSICIVQDKDLFFNWKIVIRSDLSFR